MSASHTETLRHRLEIARSLAGLMERIEHGDVRVNAAQYQQLARQLTAALAKEMPTEALQSVLAEHPYAAEVYENLHYEHAGLSRSPLNRSVASERLAKQALDRIARAARAG